MALRYVALLLLLVQVFAAKCVSKQTVSGAINQTVSTAFLQTWWHANGVVNTKTAVSNASVRQSHLYTVQVGIKTRATMQYYNSFVYETIPGNGMTTANTDGNRLGETQAWTSFLYKADVRVRIHRTGKSQSTVIVRPTNLSVTITYDTQYTYIDVPYNANGAKFSVEFQDDIRIMSPLTAAEPWNILLIFASPFNAAADIPAQSSNSLVVPQGLVTGLDTTTKTTIIFSPGTYYLTGMKHMNLSSSVTWVYFAPGAYVKGAVQFNSLSASVKATGPGVLSGEQYVWSADPHSGYRYTGVANAGLRMWSGNNGNSEQTFVLRGPCINAAPFNSMDWTGNTNLMSTDVFDYKQVGSYYFQTDGLETYAGSIVRNVFYHVNDDTIKTYYSNVLVDNVVVWKLSTAPVVQFGWASRTLDNITINAVSVIHQSYYDTASNPGLFGADNNYAYAPSGISSNHNTADTTKIMTNVTWSNFRAEGPSGCLFRICSLQKINGIKIVNAWIEKFETGSNDTTQSELPAFYDVNTGALVPVANIIIQNFQVGTTKITASNAVQVGLINVGSTYSNSITYQ